MYIPNYNFYRNRLLDKREFLNIFELMSTETLNTLN